MEKPQYVDIVSGGFPCQDISSANTKIRDYDSTGINGTRSGLWSEMFRIIRDVRPQYVIVENSSTLLFRGFEKVLSDLSKIGYDAEWQCLQASWFGLPHKRERVFVIAYPVKKRCQNNTKAFKELSEVLLKQTSRQTPLSATFKRFNSKSDFGSVRMDNGFSSELDKRRIEALGNAVVPQIANYLFECIKTHYNTIQ